MWRALQLRLRLGERREGERAGSPLEMPTYDLANYTSTRSRIRLAANAVETRNS
jgi:hypothetical protein